MTANPQQLIDAIDGKTADRLAPWRSKLQEGEAAQRTGPGGNYPTDGDIHPLRLCEEIKNFMDRDAVLCVDGQEILNFDRQSMPTFKPGHRLNSGSFGTMGVGLPFAVGAKAATPDTQVICVHGDGSFGQNAMEFDTAVRPNCRSSASSASTAAGPPTRTTTSPAAISAIPATDGRGLGLRCRICQRARGHPPGSAARVGMVGFVNVKTDYCARATTVRFSSRET